MEKWFGLLPLEFSRDREMMTSLPMGNDDDGGSERRHHLYNKRMNSCAHVEPLRKLIIWLWYIWHLQYGVVVW